VNVLINLRKKGLIIFTTKHEEDINLMTLCYQIEVKDFLSFSPLLDFQILECLLALEMHQFQGKYRFIWGPN
jgi:hypothetical protein